MLCIYNHSTEPYFNMAVEEYLLKHFSDNIFMLWRNDNAIVVGKHQNTLAEINIDFVKKNNIKVVRRLSGGGTVFHDLGNLNFTFIVNADGDELVNFRRFTKPILDVLKKLRVDARFEGRNDLTINGLKFSGNAEHVYKKRTLHHGTLLFSSEINDLTNALKVSPEKYADKAVKSVRSRVTNISRYLKDDMNVSEFAELIMKHIREEYPDSSSYELNEEDKRLIEKLRDQKYSGWEWNFGYSPKYNFSKRIKTPSGSIEVNLEVINGIIHKIRIFGDYFNTKETSEFENMFIDCKHTFDVLQKLISDVHINDYFRGFSSDEILDVMF